MRPIVKTVYLIIVAPLLYLSSCKDVIDQSKTNSFEENNAWMKLSSSKKDTDFSNFIQTYPRSRFIIPAINRYRKLKDSIDFGEVILCCRYDARVYPYNSRQVLFNEELLSRDSLRLTIPRYLKSSKLSRNVKIPRSRNYGNLTIGRIKMVVMPEESQNETLQEALILVSQGVELYKKELVQNWYGKDYEKLSDSTKFYFDKLFGERISLVHYLQPSPPPAPETGNEPSTLGID